MSEINGDDEVHGESFNGGEMRSVNSDGDGCVVVVSDHDNNREDEPFGNDHVYNAVGDGDTFNTSSFRPTIVSRHDDDDNDNNPSHHHHHHVDSQEQQQHHHDCSNSAQTVSFQIGPQHFDLIKLIGEGK